MSEVSMQELTLQDADLLPDREALQTPYWNAVINAYNIAVAAPDSTGNALAHADQTIVVVQN